jgi:hypothetical protein
MCKKRIEKAAYSVSEVNSVVWKSNDQILVVIINGQKVALALIKKSCCESGSRY